MVTRASLLALAKSIYYFLLGVPRCKITYNSGNHTSTTSILVNGSTITSRSVFGLSLASPGPKGLTRWIGTKLGETKNSNHCAEMYPLCVKHLVQQSFIQDKDGQGYWATVTLINPSRLNVSQFLLLDASDGNFDPVICEIKHVPSKSSNQNMLIKALSRGQN